MQAIAILAHCLLLHYVWQGKRGNSMVIGSWSKSRGKVIGCRSLCRFKMNRCLLCKIVVWIVKARDYIVSCYSTKHILCQTFWLKIPQFYVVCAFWSSVYIKFKGAQNHASLGRFLLTERQMGSFSKGAVCGCQSRSSKECSLAIGRRGGGENPAVRLLGELWVMRFKWWPAAFYEDTNPQTPEVLATDVL